MLILFCLEFESLHFSFFFDIRFWARFVYMGAKNFIIHLVELDELFPKIGDQDL